MNVTQNYFRSDCQRIKKGSKEPDFYKMFGFQDLSEVVVDEPEENNIDKMPEIVEHPATPQIESDEGNDGIVTIKSPDGIRKEESKSLLIFNIYFLKSLPSHYLPP